MTTAVAMAVVKTVLLLLSCVAVSWCNNVPDFSKIVHDCIAEHKPSGEAVFNMVHEHHFPNSLSSGERCFIKCVLTTLNVMDDKGTWNNDTLKEDFDADQTAVAFGCITKHADTDKCEEVFHAAQCVIDSGKFPKRTHKYYKLLLEMPEEDEK